jgi:hypothetical protein
MPFWSILWYQGKGSMTHEGTRGSAIGHRFKGNHVLDIHLLKAKRHEAVLLPGHGLLVSDDANAPEWVTYQYSIPPCPTALGTGLELLQIPAWGEATEAGSISSTSGCGTIGGGSLARSLSRGVRSAWLKLARALQTLQRRREERCTGGLLGTRMQWEMKEDKMLWYIPWYIRIYI